MLNLSNTALLSVFVILIGCCCNLCSAQAGQPPPNPKYALSNRCSGQDREAINRCEDEARRDWDIRDTDYYTSTRKFCCFVWNTLSCELSIAQRCDPEYSSKLSYYTEQHYNAFCEYHSRRSASCALRWWSLGLIILAIVIIIGVVIFVVYRKRQSKFTYDYETVTKK